MLNLIFSTKNSGKSEKVLKTILHTLNAQENTEVLLIYDVSDEKIIEIAEEKLNYLNNNTQYFFTLDDKFLNITCRTKHSTIINFSFISQSKFLKLLFNNTLTRFNAKNYQYYCVYEDVDQFEDQNIKKFSEVMAVLQNFALSEFFAGNPKELITFITYSFEESVNMKTFSKYKIFQYFMQLPNCYLEYHIPIDKDTINDDTLIL